MHISGHGTTHAITTTNEPKLIDGFRTLDMKASKNKATRCKQFAALWMCFMECLRHTETVSLLVGPPDGCCAIQQMTNLALCVRSIDRLHEIFSCCYFLIVAVRYTTKTQIQKVERFNTSTVTASHIPVGIRCSAIAIPYHKSTCAASLSSAPTPSATLWAATAASYASARNRALADFGKQFA